MQPGVFAPPSPGLPARGWRGSCLKGRYPWLKSAACSQLPVESVAPGAARWLRAGAPLHSRIRGGAAAELILEPSGCAEQSPAGRGPGGQAHWGRLREEGGAAAACWARRGSWLRAGRSARRTCGQAGTRSSQAPGS
ncbi:hypothetical protein KIL84_003884 [Mauremys mutica]|uniref:Uncharacterized protein n=1 Tax=Mauremys mutica TaxID=74926 RepID=A0A9D3WWH0_9SAUR|nr:hypothetical protein KIL84_003884 [Mauremys mutica]